MMNEDRHQKLGVGRKYKEDESERRESLEAQPLGWVEKGREVVQLTLNFLNKGNG
jgi:hypothetical protein